MGDYGNIGAAWIGVQSFDDQKTELLNLSWSRNLWGSSSIYLAASRDQQQGDWTVALSLQIPLGERDSAAVTRKYPGCRQHPAPQLQPLDAHRRRLQLEYGVGAPVKSQQLSAGDPGVA